MKKSLCTLLAVILLTTITGACYNTHQVPPQELYKLNGFRQGQTVMLTSVDGDNVKFSSKTQLNVQAADGQAMTAKYSAVQVNGSTMTGTVRGSGAPVNIDLAQVTGAETRQLSLGKTIGLAAGLGGGLIVVSVVVYVVIVLVFAASLTRPRAF